MVKAELFRWTGQKNDLAKGTFKNEAEALLWAINMVITFNVVYEVVRTDMDKRVEYTFWNAGEVKVAFMFLASI